MSDDKQCRHQPRTITWTVSQHLTVWFERCQGCNAETPMPADDVLLEIAQRNRDYNVWPHSQLPPGWMKLDHHLLCPACGGKALAASGVTAP